MRLPSIFARLIIFYPQITIMKKKTSQKLHLGKIKISNLSKSGQQPSKKEAKSIPSGCWMCPSEITCPQTDLCAL
jgi:hypothetical protein